jgi:hypothetical protein
VIVAVSWRKPLSLLSVGLFRTLQIPTRRAIGLESGELRARLKAHHLALSVVGPLAGHDT